MHIPKTGGTWVEKVLHKLELIEKSYRHEHADMEHILYPHSYREALDWVTRTTIRKLRGLDTFPATPLTFCFVRHPLSWYESWWSFNSDRGWPYWGDLGNLNKWHPNAELNGLGNCDFNQFIERVLTRYPGYVTQLYARYTGLGCNISYIGKQESLNDDLSAILSKMGLVIDHNIIYEEEKTNVSNRHREAIQWDEYLKKEVLLCEYPTLKRFGYSNDK